LRLAGPIDWLEKTHLVIKVPVIHSVLSPLRAQVKENFFKLYLFDVGILGAMVNLAPKTILSYEYRTYKGFFAENFFAQEFSAYYSFNSLYSWQENRHEVDFLIDDGDHSIPIEIKSGKNTRTKSLKIYKDKYHPQRVVVFSANKPDLVSDIHIQRFPLYFVNRFRST